MLGYLGGVLMCRGLMTGLIAFVASVNKITYPLLCIHPITLTWFTSKLCRTSSPRLGDVTSIIVLTALPLTAGQIQVTDLIECSHSQTWIRSLEL